MAYILISWITMHACKAQTLSSHYSKIQDLSLYPDRKATITWMRIYFFNFAENIVGQCQVNFLITITIIVQCYRKPERNFKIHLCPIKKEKKPKTFSSFRNFPSIGFCSVLRILLSDSHIPPCCCSIFVSKGYDLKDALETYLQCFI